MNYILEKMFPTTLYKTTLDYQFSKEEINRILKSEYFIVNNGSWSDEQFWVLDKDYFSQFKNLLQEHVNIYAKEVFKYDCEIYITSSWININPPGSYHNLHSHNNSIFSGVYYFDVPEGAPFLSFCSSRKPALCITPTEWNDSNSPTWTIKVGQGDLVIFPSEVMHEVITNNTTNTRISIAFNTFVRGSIGETSAYQFIK